MATTNSPAKSGKKGSTKRARRTANAKSAASEAPQAGRAPTPQPSSPKRGTKKSRGSAPATAGVCLTASAAKACDPALSVDERDPEFAQLIPQLGAIASRIEFANADNADDLVGHLLLRIAEGKRKGAKSPFLPWAAAVLQHEACDQWRKTRRFLTGDVPHAERADPRDDRRAFEEDHDDRLPFSPADMAKIETWKPLWVVLYFRATCWWFKLPDAFRATTIAALGLRGFPSANFDTLTTSEKAKEVRDALAMTASNASHTISRHAASVADLDFFKDMKP